MNLCILRCMPVGVKYKDYHRGICDMCEKFDTYVGTIIDEKERKKITLDIIDKRGVALGEFAKKVFGD